MARHRVKGVVEQLCGQLDSPRDAWRSCQDRFPRGAPVVRAHQTVAFKGHHSHVVRQPLKVPGLTRKHQRERGATIQGLKEANVGGHPHVSVARGVWCQGVDAPALVRLESQFQRNPGHSAIPRLQHADAVRVRPVPIARGEPQVGVVERVHPHVRCAEWCQRVRPSHRPRLAFVFGDPESSCWCTCMPGIV